MEIVSTNLYQSKKYFTTISPGFQSVLLGRAKWAARGVGLAYKGTKLVFKWKKGTPIEELVNPVEISSDFISGKVIGETTKPISTRVAKTHVAMTRTDHDWRRKNGIGGRTWITQPGQYKMVIIFQIGRAHV